MSSRVLSSQKQASQSAGSWIPVLLGVLLRSIQLWMPIVGIHSWRQADTAAMARNFYLSNTPIWLPQIDWGGASPGFVESEFPLFPYLTSQLYQLFGLHEWLGRSLSVIFSGLTIWLVIRLGRRWFNPIAGWWGGIAMAVAPLGVYYGRSFQAEALLLFCAAAALESHSLWRSQKSKWALILSWVLFTTAALLKVIPLLWLGLPLLLVEITQSRPTQAESLRRLVQRGLDLLRNPGFWIYSAASIAVVAGWYLHAYQLGASSGLSFGFWGAGTDRGALSLVLDGSSWLNLTLRVALRLLVVVWIPLLILGIHRSWKTGGGHIALGGLAGMLLCTIATMRASTIHEYYQLPVLLFTSPLIGLGWQIVQQHGARWQSRGLLCLGLVVSLTVLSVDYWAVEQRQSRAWMPLALTIRRDLPADSRLVSVTSTDPTLLNLARSQGWLITSEQLSSERIKQLRDAGATHLAGSFIWDTTYQSMPDNQQDMLRELAASSPGAWVDKRSQTYLIPIDERPSNPD